MPDKQTAPYGSWKSPIQAAQVASGGVGLGALEVSGQAMCWLEGRPAEAGRVVIVRREPDGTIADLTPPGPDYNVRTTVHEYGGGSYFAHGDTVYFSNFADQRLYRQRPGEEPQAMTPAPAEKWGVRYADGRVTPDGRMIICVREDHREEGEAHNSLVSIHIDRPDHLHDLAAGRDFYSNPRISPDGKRLAWLCWDHPNMPWDGTELWVADLAPDGMIQHERKVAGGQSESIFQPEWSPDGVLHFISDSSGWWNLYRLDEATGKPVALAPLEAEFGGPQWVFSLARYTFLSDGCIAAVYSQEGFDHLALIEPDGTLKRVETAFTCFYPATIRVGPDGRVWLIGGSATHPQAVVALDADTGQHEVIRLSRSDPVDPAYTSVPQAIEFPTTGGRTAHALYYPPANADFEGPPDERPPLLVISHGGPTSHTDSLYSPSIQYWTSRGIAIVDVNYGGSTGYGRAYRQRLNGQWGIVDVEDCINAAKYLVDQGRADGERLSIRGGSAGGYTTLAALTFHDVFAAGASYFGVSDLEALALDTHKFESRYLDSMIGPYPQDKAVYEERSPIHHTERLSSPMILFQGLEDKVVPPAQAEKMVKALRYKELPYVYIAYEGEQHGFRQAANIQRSLEAELSFYGQLFGFELADAIAPVEIENMD